MNCCAKCFRERHTYLAELIAQQGTSDDCDYCGSSGVKCLPAEALRPAFEPVVARFERWDPAKHVREPGSSDPRKSLFELMKLFGTWSDDLSCEQRHALFADIVGPETADPDVLWVSPIRYWKDGPWPSFCRHIKRERRFIPDGKNPSVSTFLDVLEKALADAAIDVPEGTVYYRARIGGTALDYIPEPFKPENMGAPPPESAGAGRANSSGIPVLYAATDERTAVAEARPWKHAHVTVAELKLVRPVRLVNADLQLGGPEWSPFGRPDLDAHYASVGILTGIGSSLAEPVSPQTRDVDYLPTQYVAEAVRDAGYDGMLYRSAMGPGTNALFFDPALAEVTDTMMVWVYGIDYKYDDATPRDDGLITVVDQLGGVHGGSCETDSGD